VELVSNLVWMFLAVVIARLLLCNAPSKGLSRRTQFVAVAMLILILFPVISVTDDLQAGQTLVEDDVYLRRNLIGASPHSAFPVVAVLSPPVLTEPFFSFLRFNTLYYLHVPILNAPPLSAIQNRPPPTF